MRILVIGETGFIGPHVVKNLVDRGHHVTVFHRGQTTADLPACVHEITGNRAALADFTKKIRRIGPDAVVDMISYSLDDARLLVQALKGIAGRLIVVSSMDVYRAYGLLIGLECGEPAMGLLNEDAPLRASLYPRRPDAIGSDDLSYNYEKIMIERTVSAATDLRATILRLPAIYGPGDIKRNRTFPFFEKNGRRQAGHSY